MKILILGASSAGLAAAARLRRLDETAKIIIIESEAAAPIPDRLKSLYNIDIRLSTQIAWPGMPTVDEHGPGLDLEDTLTGRTYRESFDRIIYAAAGQTDRVAMTLPVRRNAHTNILHLSDLTNFDIQWQQVEAYLAAYGPRTAVICGADMISLMAAQHLAAHGIATTIITPEAAVPTDFDHDIACHITHLLQRNGVKIITKANIEGRVVEDGGKVHCHLPIGVFVADMAIYCSQAFSVTASAASQAPPPDAQNPVARCELTLNHTAENILTGMEAPASHMAPMVGRLAADIVYGGELDDQAQDPYNEASIFLRQTEIFGKIAAVFGFCEKELNQQKMDYIFSVVPVAGGFLKLIYDADGEILGFAALGHDTTQFAGFMSAIVQMDGCIYDLVGLELPATMRPLQTLGKIAQNVIEKRLSMAYWDEITAIDATKTTLLDVRHAVAHQAQHIPGSINIPLADLRNSLYRLDFSKEIITICDTGKESYLAARILTPHAPKLRHATGGMAYYAKIHP
ncbi:MAG: FAD-dependent oxidoreductase [Defluviitaleaceae bacterium]|nr:FAD-dependent oxidoreductase [Defluviitaleaceae bacterium]